MGTSKQSGNSYDENKASRKGSKNSSSKWRKTGSDASDEEVLLNLPAGMKYKLPSRQQRIVVASIVIGLNTLLLIAVGLYFYNPAFKQFIYNVGRS